MNEWIGTEDPYQEWIIIDNIQWLGKGVAIVVTKSYVGSSVSGFYFESKNPPTNYYFESK